jgi:hypothetical protein
MSIFRANLNAFGNPRSLLPPSFSRLQRRARGESAKIVAAEVFAGRWRIIATFKVTGEPLDI